MAGTLVTGDLIRTARDAHPSFDERRQPSTILLRALASYHRRLLAEIIRRDPDAVVSKQETALPLVTFSAGISLPAYKQPRGVAAVHGSGREHRIEIVGWTDRNAYGHAAYIQSGVLYLTGKERHWSYYDLIRFYYVPEPGPITLALETVLTLIPDGAQGTLEAFLAYTMARRAKKEDDVNPAGLKSDWEGEEMKFLREASHRRQAVTSIVKETF